MNYAMAVKLSLVLGIASDGPQDEVELKLAPEDGLAQQIFGFSVDLFRDTLVVGARNDDKMGTGAGAAYVFVRRDSKWTQQAKLLASDGAPADFFGESVSVHGDTIVVGARGRDDSGNNAGAAYVFERRGEDWVEQSKLLSSDGERGDELGESVCVSEDTIIVGACHEDGKAANTGAAYIFMRSGSGWTQQAKLVIDDSSKGDFFGGAVTLHGDTAVVAADHVGSAAGAVYVFERRGGEWQRQAMLVASDATPRDFFGRSVGVWGSRVVVGSRGDDDLGPSSGSAYVFERSGSSWKERAKLLASDGNEKDEFGISVSVHGDRIVVGARAAGGAAEATGSAYRYEIVDGDWEETAKLFARAGSAGQRFGCSVAAFSEVTAIGADGDDAHGPHSGSVFLYSPGPGTVAKDE